ncbi:helix-turn-helix transcriptional regulator [Qaidamihabitans albus]|uniref:helix-turn-helix transcriptional regulator n=1 Tax=Qaidamihabitans albus TaxID=2795733 RepID=UPI0018F10BBB|nr:helix-turn-helix transcriptional regulator [Qaidamihabitans albus]
MVHPMKEARNLRGWSVTQLQMRLYAEASKTGLKLPDKTSLRVMISKWENGHRQPDSMYRSLLESIYGLPAPALGFETDEGYATDPAEGALQTLARRAGSRALEQPAFQQYFTDQLAQHVVADNLLGPSFVVGTAEAQASDLTRLINRSGERAPLEVFRLAARFNEFTGWLLQDSTQLKDALDWTNKAVDLAKVSNDLAVSAYCLMRKSAILEDLGRGREALAVATESVELAQRVAPELLPVCYKQQALATAACAKARDAELLLEIALDTAEKQAPSSLGEYCTPAYVEMEAARCWISLGRPEKAVDACQTALNHWPTELVRDQSLCAAHLMLALTQTMRSTKRVP